MPLIHMAWGGHVINSVALLHYHNGMYCLGYTAVSLVYSIFHEIGMPFCDVLWSGYIRIIGRLMWLAPISCWSVSPELVCHQISQVQVNWFRLISISFDSTKNNTARQKRELHAYYLMCIVFSEHQNVFIIKQICSAHMIYPSSYII